MRTKTVVEIDLVGYNDVCRTLEQSLGPEAVGRLNEQIKEFIKAPLATIEGEYFVINWTGDGAILAFDVPAAAHMFAAAVHRAAQAHNVKRSIATAQRWFRIGVATDKLFQGQQPGGEQESAGTVIATAKRLEAAAQPGQVVADAATFASLPAELQALYGSEERVPGKRDEMFAARRCTIVPYTTADGAPPTVESVLELSEPPARKRSKGAVRLVLGVILVAGAAGVWWWWPVPPPRLSPISRPPPFDFRFVKVRDGLPLSITLADDIPAGAAKGGRIRFTVSKDCPIDDAVAIHRGASVVGEIAQESKKKFLGRGKMMLGLLTVEAAPGQTLNIRATPTHRDGQLWRPADFGGLKLSKGIAAAAGTQYVAYIDGDQTVKVPK